MTRREGAAQRSSASDGQGVLHRSEDQLVDLGLLEKAPDVHGCAADLNPPMEKYMLQEMKMKETRIDNLRKLDAVGPQLQGRLLRGVRDNGLDLHRDRLRRSEPQARGGATALVGASVSARLAVGNFRSGDCGRGPPRRLVSSLRLSVELEVELLVDKLQRDPEHEVAEEATVGAAGADGGGAATALEGATLSEMAFAIIWSVARTSASARSASVFVSKGFREASTFIVSSPIVAIAP